MLGILGTMTSIFYGFHPRMVERSIPDCLGVTPSHDSSSTLA